MSALTKAVGEAEHRKLIEALAEICERDGITVERLAAATIKSLTVDSKQWQAMHKDADGEAVISTLQGGGTRLTLSPSWETGPKWPVVAPATLPRITPTKRAGKRTDGATRVLIVPDVHISHIRPTDSDAVEAAWDEPATSALRRVAGFFAPDTIVQVGDLLDLAEHGSFDHWPAWSRTTQADMQAGCQWWAQWRADHPDARLVMLEGNHELRLAKAMVRNNSAALGITPAQLPGEDRGWPAHSIPTFLRLDDLGVEWLPGYPSTALWLTDDLAVVHGTSDPSKKDLGLHHSVIMGHWHRRVERWLTRQDRSGAHLVAQICCGTMSPVDGRTPSGQQALDAHGRPIRIDGVDPWQQGAVAVTVFDDQRWTVEQVAIKDGQAMFRGQVF